MQNLNSNLCTTTPTRVIDTRDNEEYLVQRFANGCIMLDNLRLGGEALYYSLLRTLGKVGVYYSINTASASSANSSVVYLDKDICPIG